MNLYSKTLDHKAPGIYQAHYPTKLEFCQDAGVNNEHVLQFAPFPFNPYDY